ncbi:MAG: hypothetical protein D3924_00790, partial [Candidatus Electrothrix sp. AR4]|nr:hypothetical protein [Candidatus Electrothrix sp. AR4]
MFTLVSSGSNYNIFLIAGNADAAVKPCDLTIEVLNRKGSDADTMTPYISIKNLGSQAIEPERLTVRYYYTDDGGTKPYSITNKLFRWNGARSLSLMHVNLQNSYIDVSFDSSLPDLIKGRDSTIKYSIKTAQLENWDYNNDFSYTSSFWEEDGKIAVYCDGVKIAGTEPDAGNSSCSDGIQNGDETGVDCGGSCPNACSSCSDGVQNGDETDIDCGGS